MLLAEREQALLETFEWVEDPTERYELIIDIGKEMAPISEELKIEANEIKGCQSKVWLVHDYKDLKVNFYADSNTVITKGIVSILVKLWSGLSPIEIRNATIDILDTIELRSHLSSQRNNGLNAMIEKMKKIASQYE
jgi:cysteine desulfuration protein SufE